MRNVPVYTIDGVEKVRDVVINMYRVSAESVEELPETVDVEWTGYRYVAEFKGTTEAGDPIYVFNLSTD